MKSIKVLSLVLFLAFSFVMILGQDAFAQKRMTFEEYQTEFKTLQDREQKAKAAIEEERGSIAQLRAEIDNLHSQIAALWDQIFAFLGMTREEYEAFVNKLDNADRRLKELEGLSPDRLLERVKDIDDVASMLTAMSNENPAKIPSLKHRIEGMQARIERLRNSLPKPQHDMYSVIRGDHLWKIAGKKDIFGDSWKWMRIYSANRVEIKNPDLIYPAQKLRIPRQIGRDEHLVQRGESLQKIARTAYGDPFQWTKIYQANKSGNFLSEPNLIYPEMILSIPR